MSTTNPENETPSPNNIPLHNIEIEQMQSQDETDQHQMILTIDVGNKIEQLKIYDITNPNKDIYEFCFLHKLSYFNMEEITKQITEVIAEQGKTLLHNQNEINKPTKEEDKSEHIYYTVSVNNKEPIKEHQDHQKEITNEMNNTLNKSPETEVLTTNENEHKEKKAFTKKQPEGKNNSINISKNLNKTHRIGNNNKLFVYQVCDRPCSENKKKRYYNSVLNKKVHHNSKGTSRSKPSFQKHLQSESPNYHTSTQSRQVNNNNNLISKSCSNNNNKDDNQMPKEQHIPITLNELLQNEIIKLESNRYILSKEKQNNITKGKDISNVNKPEQVQKHKTKRRNINNANTKTGEIYERNIKFKENTKKRVESLRDTLNKSDDELFTFQPKINKISARVLLKRQNNQNECYNPERIRNYKKYFEQKLEKHKQDIIPQDDFDNCTFKPEINSRSQTIENRKKKSNNIFTNNLNPPKEAEEITESKTEQVTTQPNPNHNRFEKLYLDSCSLKQHIQQKQQEVDSEFTYCPLFINNNSRIKTPFNERLEQYSSKSKEKINKIKQNINEEEQTNNTFHPNLFGSKRYEKRKQKNSKPNHHKNTRNNDVFNNLYIYNQIYSQRKNETNQQINQKEKQVANTKNVNESSNVLIENKKLNSFKKIFSLLDGDEDGLINSINMNKKNLPNKVKDILNPIFSWLQNEKESINEEDFICIMEQFYSYLPYDKRRAIISMDKAKPLHPTHNNCNSFSFKPNLISKQTSKTNPNKKTQCLKPNNVGLMFNNTNKDLSALTHITKDNNANCHNIKTEHYVN